MLTRKSSKSKIFFPAPNGEMPLHILNPRIHGTDKIRIAIRLQITDFFLLHPVSSIANVMIFSKTAMIVDAAAKNIHRKNNVPQILPPLIALKIFGSVIKIRLGPCPGFTPNAKHAGKMIIPAISATQVSRIVTQIASPVSARFLSI